MSYSPTSALDLCNACDAPLESPNPAGYCAECLGEIVIEGTVYSARFNDDPDCPVSIWVKR